MSQKNGRGTRIKSGLQVIKTIWLILGNTLLLVILLELMLSVPLAIRDRMKAAGSAAVVDPRFKADVYPIEPWVRKMYFELEECSLMDWHPYVHWRRKPYSGEYINIDSHGNRRTTQVLPTADADSLPLKVFLFGGSTMWSTGARDDHTIPSCLGRELHDREIFAETVNFGESGFVSTQGVMSLVAELNQGNIPDLVIFYDGVNDTFSGYQSQVAGHTQNEFKRRREFNLTHPRRIADLRTEFVVQSYRASSIGRTIRGLQRRIGLSEERAADAIPDQEPLAEQVVEVYQRNQRIVGALAAAYEFDSIFYWQPAITSKKHLTDYERTIPGVGDAAQEFFDEVYGLMKDRQPKFANVRFFNISDIFDEVAGPVYIDWCHVGEKANAVIANRMATDILATRDSS